MGIGLFASYDEISNWVSFTKTVSPDPACAGLYSEYYRIYLELYRRNQDLMHQVYGLI
jgi:hypothetical protein